MSWSPFRSFDSSYYYSSSTYRHPSRHHGNSISQSPFHHHGSGVPGRSSRAHGNGNSDVYGRAHQTSRNPYSEYEAPFTFDPSATNRNPRPTAGSAGDNFWTSERARLNRMIDGVDQRDHVRRRDMADQETSLHQAALSDGYVRYPDGEYRPRRRRYQPGPNDYVRTHPVVDAPRLGQQHETSNPTPTRRRDAFANFFSGRRRQDTDEDEEFRRARQRRTSSSRRRPYWV